MLELHQYHTHLRQHFKTLSDEREPAPVFLVEHELTHDGLSDMTSCLTQTLQAALFRRDSFWNSCYLPLLVLAAEVGYAYEGLGSEFWPALEQRVSTSFDEGARDALEWYFRQQEASTRVRPVESRRSERFHRIAWPVAHAILPRRLRSALVALVYELLSHFPIMPGQVPLQALVKALQQRLAVSNDIQHQLLPQREDVLTVLVSAVLFEEPPENLWLSRALWDRLSADLEPLRKVEPAPRTASTLRRTRKQSAALDEGQSTSQTSAAPLIFQPRELPFQLEKLPKNFRLHVQLPPLPAVLESILEDMDESAHRIRLSGQNRSLFLENFLSGNSISLDDGILEPGAGGTSRELIQKESLGNLPQGLADWLASLRIRATFPLLFERREGTPLALQRTQFTTADSYWLVCNAPKQPVEGVTKAGSLGTFTVYSVEPSQSAAAQWLAEQRFSQLEVGGVKMLSLPFVHEQTRTKGSLLRGDSVFIQLTGPGVRLGPGRGSELAPGLYRISPEQSRVAFRLSGAATADISISWEDQRPPPSSLITLSWSQVPSIEALSSGLLKLELHAPFSMRFLTLSCRLADGPRTLYHQELAVSVPCVLDVSSQLDGLVACVDKSRQRSLQLETSIPRLLRQHWNLFRSATIAPPAQRARDLWAVSTLPWELRPQASAQAECAFLKQPVDHRGFPCLGAGVIEHDGPLKLSTLKPEWPRVRRQLESVEGSRGGVGLRTLSHAYLSWSTATLREPTHRLLRAVITRQLELLTVEVLCGPDWQDAECGFKPADRPIPFILHKLLELGELRDEASLQALSQTLPKPEESVRRALEVRLQPLTPSIEAMLTAQAVDDESVQQLRVRLEEAAERAYTQLLHRHAATPEWEPDLSVSDSTLRKVLKELSQQWLATEQLEPLPSLILPRWLVRQLKQLSSQPSSLERLSERLLEWLGQREGLPFHWTEHQVFALLKLWCAPLTNEEADINALDAAIADRQASRAIRYAALRWLAATKGGRWSV